MHICACVYVSSYMCLSTGPEVFKIPIVRAAGGVEQPDVGAESSAREMTTGKYLQPCFCLFSVFCFEDKVPYSPGWL